MSDTNTPNAGGDDEIVVMDADETAPQGTEVVIADESPAPAPVVTPDEGIENLRARLGEERQAREAAERRAEMAQHQAQNANREVADTNLTLVKNAINTVKQQQNILKANLRAALSTGDYGKAAELQDHMSMNSAKMLQLENGRAAMESAPPPQVERTQPQQADPVELLASQLTPRSAAWVRSNPQYARDQRLYQKMVAAHNLAVADGYAPDSDDYFSVVEQTLNVNRNAARHEETALSSASTPKATRQSSGVPAVPPAAAPVSRTGTPTGTNPNIVRLTREEKDMAASSGLTEQEYAKQKLALQREGKIGR